LQHEPPGGSAELCGKFLASANKIRSLLYARGALLFGRVNS
jgi:hypothetical protein